jgi:hypothetical protein
MIYHKTRSVFSGPDNVYIEISRSSQNASIFSPLLLYLSNRSERLHSPIIEGVVDLFRSAGILGVNPVTFPKEVEEDGSPSYMCILRFL